ncbi:TerB N-terminal domain-containing protein [Alloscardovia macacae]|uniref:TerB-N n=1 Tax=Alloscardovia macacae TaxID=1160091 RepID=A0A261F6R7_9BIFI|nr:TerB N-terminal domain-containing protein [Alloscardovia macacae]OZG54849.1 TerB-N [Alloscardovia macacae]
MDIAQFLAYAQEMYGIEAEPKLVGAQHQWVLCHPDTGAWLALLLQQWDETTGEYRECMDVKCGTLTPLLAAKPYMTSAIRMRSSQWVGVFFGDDAPAYEVSRLLDMAMELEDRKTATFILDEKPHTPQYEDSALPFARLNAPNSGHVWGSRHQLQMPEKIRDMMQLYDFADTSPAAKAKNFVRQGRFMAAYEDRTSWDFDVSKRYTTYHDLNLRELRGYFSWRTALRRGSVSPVSRSLAYMYVSELLCGIGANSPKDVLHQLGRFEKNYATMWGGSAMLNFIRTCQKDYAILHGFGAEVAKKYLTDKQTYYDGVLSVLKNAASHTDKDVFQALCAFEEERLWSTPVFKEDHQRGEYLFAQLWRRLLAQESEESESFFEKCFGHQETRVWYPLREAVYWEELEATDTDVVLHPLRSYHLRSGHWSAREYDPEEFHRDVIEQMVHGADRIWRKQLKVRGRLQARSYEAWVEPHAQAVLDEYVAQQRRAEEEARRESVKIDFTELDTIRHDAHVTQESLLTQEERESAEYSEPRESSVSTESIQSDRAQGARAEETEEIQNTPDTYGLDAQTLHILDALLAGDDVRGQLEQMHAMASLVAEQINEAFFEEIGDMVVDSDGQTITLVEDYRDDVRERRGEKIGRND